MPFTLSPRETGFSSYMVRPGSPSIGSPNGRLSPTRGAASGPGGLLLTPDIDIDLVTAKSTSGTSPGGRQVGGDETRCHPHTTLTPPPLLVIPLITLPRT